MKRLRDVLDRWSSFRPSSGSCQIGGFKIMGDAGPLRAFLCDFAPFAHPLPAEEPIQIFKPPDDNSSKVLVPHVEQNHVDDNTIQEQKIKTRRIPGTDIEVTPTMTLGEYYVEMKKSIDQMSCEDLYNNLDLARTTRDSIFESQLYLLLTTFISVGSKRLGIECPSWYAKLREKYKIKEIERLAEPWKWD